jgi:hypothetical protein
MDAGAALGLVKHLPVARTEHRLLAAFCKHSRRGGACSDLELAPAPDGTGRLAWPNTVAALPLKRPRWIGSELADPPPAS